MKKCTKCHEIKDLSNYYKHNTNKDGHFSSCRECNRIRLTNYRKYYYGTESSKNWRNKNKVKITNDRMKKDYGITLEEYDKMLKDQNNLCLICENPETSINPYNKKIVRLSIDHCHKTGKIRGLLCGNCNRLIGLAKEDVI